ncbi:MAG TPA: prephenate dehydrogenase [Tepidisphaeraceae bacterium]
MKSSPLDTLASAGHLVAHTTLIVWHLTIYRTMTIQRLSILGVGLLGGSIGLAVKAITKSCHIVGYGHRPETLEAAQRMGAIDENTGDPTRAVQDSELVILCTPVSVITELLKQIGSSCKPGTILTDVGSTKRTIVKIGEQLLPAGVHFVGSHPMAGSEKRGIEHARADLYRGALCITTPAPKTNSGALGQVESFWQELGMRVTRLAPDDHDRLLADVSHLPHALAAALVAMQPDQALPLAGKGFLDVTRIAGGDGGLWRDIFLDNSDSLRDSIRRLRLQLDRLESMLSPAQSEALRRWLDAAAQKRGQADA